MRECFVRYGIDQITVAPSIFHLFRDKTGVTPAIITVDNREWKGYYNDLENYAYDRYVNMFPDEKHWLIVYSSDLAAANDTYMASILVKSIPKVFSS